MTNAQYKFYLYSASIFSAETPAAIEVGLLNRFVKTVPFKGCALGFNRPI
jgi:hypothetical protein